MAEYLAQNRETRSRDVELLEERSDWLVVVRTIVVHCDVRTATTTGLFGISGDLRVQVLDLEESTRITQLLDLAETCERALDVTVTQDFRREMIQTAAEDLEKRVKSLYGYGIAARIRPAIMFRLCTQMCNNRKVVAARERASRESPSRGRGRGSRARANCGR